MLTRKERLVAIPRLIVVARGNDLIKSVQATTCLRMLGVKPERQETLEYRSLLSQAVSK